jgi:hypothetical protein
VVLYAIIMPTTWIDDLPREEAQKMVVELGVPAKGAVHGIRLRLKEKWKAMEQYLPPRRADESERGLGVAGTSYVKNESSDVQAQSNYLQAKLRGRVVADMLRGIPVLLNTEPENVFGFLIRVRQVYDLGLATDEEFLTHIVTKMTGRLTRIVGAHLRLGSSWESVSSEILSTIFPLHIREGFLSRFVLDHFQTATEDMSESVTSVVAAASVLQYQVAEPVLVRRLVQNLHPHVHSHLVFASEPRSIKKLLLASHVAEASAVDERRGALNTKVPRISFQQEGRDSALV